MPRFKATNPFYVLLLIAGVAFALTACTYGVMVVQKRDPFAEQDQAREGHSLIELMDSHGSFLLIVELAVLAIATVAAISTDEFWSRKSARASRADDLEDPLNTRSPQA